MMKKFVVLLTVFAMMLSLTACGDSEEATEQNSATNENGELEGELVIWTYYDGVQKAADAFMAENPGVTIEVEVFPGDQYQTKLISVLQTGEGVPDVFALEASYVGKFINEENVCADLSEMGVEDIVADDIPYVTELGRAQDETIRAVTDNSSPGALWYQKDVAEKYLGTSDPEEIYPMIDTWEEIVALGEQVYAESNGEVRLFSDALYLFDIAANNVEPWVQDGQLVIDPMWEDAYNKALESRAKNVDGALPFMSGGWSDGLNNGTVLFTPMPSWATYMIDDEDGSAEGKFRIVQSPVGFYTGGTYYAIYEDSPNKELAYEFIKFMTSDEWQQQNLEENASMPADNDIWEANMDTYTSPYTGDQKILQVYYDQIASLPAVKSDQYYSIYTTWIKVAKEGVDNAVPYEEMLPRFVDEVQNAYPELEYSEE